jgi:large subunit ribosomal protein L22
MQVTAKLKNLRRSPRKIRLMAEMLTGITVKEAEGQLKFIVKGSTPNFEKLLKSAIANAENNFGLDKENLFIKKVSVDEGPKLKRWMPRAHGRASLILKRTSNIEIILEEIVEGKGRKKVKKQEIKEVKETGGQKKKETEEIKEEKKEAIKERGEKEFIDEKKKAAESKGFLKKVFRRKSM